MSKHMLSIENQVLGRIHSQRPGSAFTAVQFADLGSRGTIHQILSRAARRGEIRRLAHGLYDLPAEDPRLGELSPNEDSIVKAIAGRDASRLQAAGAAAASALGLTTQVPQVLTYLTDGKSKRIHLGNRRILLKQASPKQLATAGRISGTVIQALRWIGRKNISDSTEEYLRRRLSPSEKSQLLSDIRYAPAWIAEVMKRIAEPQKELDG